MLMFIKKLCWENIEGLENLENEKWTPTDNEKDYNHKKHWNYL